MTQVLNSCGSFEIRKCAMSGLWLYWLGDPIKHLTLGEYGDLELLMKTTDIKEGIRRFIFLNNSTKKVECTPV